MKVLPTMGSSYSGSLRGITASHNKGGLYFRGRTIPTNPSTGLQSTVRGAFGGLSQLWSTSLTQMQRDAWDVYAQNVSWVDALGQTIQLSGVNHYVRANTPRIQSDMVLGTSMGIISDAPTLYELGNSPMFSAIVMVNAAGPPNVITVDLTWSTTGFAAGDEMLVYLGLPQNAGVKGFKGPYVLAGTFGAETGTDNVVIFDGTPGPTPYSDRFGEIGVGTRLFGYARVTKVDGRLSQRVEFDAGVVPVAA